MNIIVTGGSRGIGQAIVERLLADGHKVVFTYNSSVEAAEKIVADNTEKFGPEVVASFKSDVTDADQVTQLVKDAEEFFGAKVDGLINNAGINRDTLTVRMSEEDFNAVLQTNLTGPFLMAKAVIPGMMRAKQGRIVNLSSIVGLYGNIGQANYSSSKAGIIGLTKTLSKEYAKRNILVNAVAPGMIETEMTDNIEERMRETIIGAIGMGRLGTVEEVAGVVSFLMSEDSSYITGQVIEVSGGIIS